MRVLALDTTTPDGSVAIVDDDRVIVERGGDRARSHTERLPVDILSALHDARLTSADIDLFAVVAGPGSFTGLRTGIATMQGFAIVHGRRVVALSALDALGEVAGEGLAPGTIVAAWMDAHRHEVFSTLYRIGDAPPRTPERLIEIETARVGDPAATLVRWMAQETPPTVIAGNGATLYSEIVAPVAAGREWRDGVPGETGRPLVRPHPPLASIAGQMAVARARRGLTIVPAGIQPIYVRRPDAEVLRDARRAAETPPVVSRSDG